MSKEEIELTEHRAMITLPENAVSVTINAKVYHNGELIDVSRELPMSDLRDAFRKADEGYVDDDDRYVLTDKGYECLEAFEKEQHT